MEIKLFIIDPLLFKSWTLGEGEVEDAEVITAAFERNPEACLRAMRIIGDEGYSSVTMDGYRHVYSEEVRLNK